MTTRGRRKLCKSCGATIIEQPRWSNAQWDARSVCDKPDCRYPRVVNSYRIEGDIAYIDVSTPKFPNKEAMIDAGDIPLVLDGRGKWYARFANGTTFYATREVRSPDGRTSAEQMHRVIFRLAGGHEVVPDHEDHNGLNNRRANLRLTDHNRNRANGPACRPGAYKGVSLRRFRSGTIAYRARIRIDGNLRTLGHFATADAAARAYDAAALSVWGEFAYLNFPKAP